MSGNRTLTANFQQITTLTINRSPTTGGTVTPVSGDSHPTGEPISITATPTQSHIFASWTVTGTGATIANENSATTTVTMTANATITANFRINPFNPNINYDTLTDSRDGKSYRTVTIGTQTWMAENLNFNANSSVCYDNIPSNCNTYGRLYDWNTAMGGTASSSASPSGRRGICPADWHIPSNAEWTTLTNFIGSNAGTKLKSHSGWNNDGNRTDEFGFSALPGGTRLTNGGFLNVNVGSAWWSATEYESTGAWRRYMLSGYDNVGDDNDVKGSSFSVRCVAD